MRHITSSSLSEDNAYYLHKMPYRDNAAIVTFFTENHGKLRAIVHGLHQKKSPKNALLQPCLPLQIQFQYKEGLSRVKQLLLLPGKAPDIRHFMWYQYANELLLTCLPEAFATPVFFKQYQQFIDLLVTDSSEVALRFLELALLESTLGLPRLLLPETAHLIKAEKTYYFYPDTLQLSEQRLVNAFSLSGEAVLNFAAVLNQFHQNQILSDVQAQLIKPLTRVLIQQLLSGKSLKTRSIFPLLQHYSAAD